MKTLQQNLVSVPPKSLDAALAHLRKGGRLIVRTSLRVTVIDGKVLAKFEKAGIPLLRESGDGYRLTTGKRSVYLFPGQLEAIEERWV